MIFLFHRLEFLAFFALIFVVYWALPRRGRNAFLLLASYAFYASWDWRFLACILVSTGIDYGCGLAISRSERERTRRALLAASVVANLGLLIFFKYLGFLTESLGQLVHALGLPLSTPTLQLIIPLGISFYTFQTMSYSIDVYRRRIEATTDIVDFALFVAYFPQLIAGPIEKARDLLPQIQRQRTREDLRWREGAFLFAYGWALKVIVGDPAGQVVKEVFSLDAPSAVTVLVGLYAFALQIYGDFAGYSKMARGISHLLGIRLSVNFNLPFFATGYVDFYRRWHITLSSWIGEYVYNPLYYRLPRGWPLRGVRSLRLRMWLAASLALLITRMIFAVWHGAALSFVLLGLYIFLAQMVTVALRPLGRRLVPASPAGRLGLRVLQSLVMVHLFCFAMIFFRSQGLAQIQTLTAALLSCSGPLDAVVAGHLPYLAGVALFFGAHEAVQYRKDDPLWISRQGFWVNALYYLALYFIFRQGQGIGDQQFLYFGF